MAECPECGAMICDLCGQNRDQMTIKEEGGGKRVICVECDDDE